MACDERHHAECDYKACSNGLPFAEQAPASRTVEDELQRQSSVLAGFSSGFDIGDVANDVDDAALGSVSMSALTDAIRSDIMEKVEAIIVQKEESLWQRGQAELTRLQQDRLQLSGCIQELDTRQEQLLLEHANLRGALIDITSKLETVATTMREALQHARHRQEGASDDSGNFDASACSLTAVESSQPSASQADDISVGRSFAEDSPPGHVRAQSLFPGLCDGPQTPRRQAPRAAPCTTGERPVAKHATFAGGSSALYAMPIMPESPAVKISLANVLTSAQAPGARLDTDEPSAFVDAASPTGADAASCTGGDVTPMRKASPLEKKKLNIADCLDLCAAPPLAGGGALPGASAALGCLGLSLELEALVGSTMGSPLCGPGHWDVSWSHAAMQLAAASPLPLQPSLAMSPEALPFGDGFSDFSSGDASAESYNWQFRAEAPTFVPGGSPSATQGDALAAVSAAAVWQALQPQLTT